MLKHQELSLSFRSTTVPSVGASEWAFIDAIIRTSIAASLPVLFARSPAEPMLYGSDEMSAIETSVSNEVEQLEQLDRANAIMACAVKPIPIATMGCTMGSTH